MKLLFSKFSKKNKLLLILVASIFCVEFFVTFFVYFDNMQPVRYSGVYKVLFIFFFLFFGQKKHIDIKLLYLLMCLISLVSINQFFIGKQYAIETLSFQISKGSFYYLFRFIYLFIFALVFNTLDKSKSLSNSMLFLIERILLVNTVFIFLGFVFELNFFKSYPYTSRFGYDGFFNKVNEASYFYIICTSSIYYKLINGQKNNIKFLIILVFANLMLGTKLVILYLFILSVFHFSFVSVYKKNGKKVMTILAIISITFYKQISSWYFNFFPFWSELKKQYSVFTLLFSKRDLLFRNNLEYINSNWSMLNFLVGGPHYTRKFIRSEMDIVDLFLFFGIVGVLIYAFLIKSVFFEKKKFIKTGLLIIVFFCGMFGGGLLLSSGSMLFLFLFAKDNSIQKND